VKNTDNMLTILQNHVNQTGVKIDVLNISGHGSAGGGVNWGSGGKFDYGNLSPEQIARLRVVLAPDAHITVWACSQGAGNFNLGQVQKLADALGVSIFVTPYACNSGPNCGQTIDQIRRWWNEEDKVPTWIEIKPHGNPPNNDIDPKKAKRTPARV
jgi:hypothetical protein